MFKPGESQLNSEKIQETLSWQSEPRNVPGITNRLSIKVERQRLAEREREFREQEEAFKAEMFQKRLHHETMGHLDESLMPSQKEDQRLYKTRNSGKECCPFAEANSPSIPVCRWTKKSIDEENNRFYYGSYPSRRENNKFGQQHNASKDAFFGQEGIPNGVLLQKP